MDRSIVVEQASEADLDAAVLLFNAYRVFYRQSSDMDAARRFLNERFRRRDAVMFLARMDGAACGFTQLYPSLSSVSMRPVWILNDLYVSPTARKRGVGRRLMDRARDFAHAGGAVRIELTTEHDNTTAQALYRACGYARDDVFYKFVLTLDTSA